MPGQRLKPERLVAMTLLGEPLVFGRDHAAQTLVVAGVRPAWAGADDQKRFATPAEAVAKGADFLVIGRPITGAPDPVEAARRIAAEVAEAGG